MNSQLETIIQNLEEGFNGEPWYGVSVIEKLNSVSWHIVNERIYGAKSIAVLVQHVINWRAYVLKHLEGDANLIIEMDSENDWTTIHIKTEEEWFALIAILQDTQSELIQRLSEKTDALLEITVPGVAYTFKQVLNGISQHDSYHLGQISMLNTMK
jgi:uncharacterized damage-inducible protein DinB